MSHCLLKTLVSETKVYIKQDGQEPSEQVDVAIEEREKKTIWVFLRETQITQEYSGYMREPGMPRKPSTRNKTRAMNSNIENIE